MNTKPPLPPPFPVGAKVKYLGKSKWWKVQDDGTKAVSTEPDMVVPIVDVVEGRQGTGQLMMVDDDYHQIFDETENGYSVYDAGKGGQWIIWPENAKDWELVSKIVREGEKRS